MVKPPTHVSLLNEMRTIHVYQTLWVALLYIVCARIGQMFAIEPANVTPIWIPSGIMLALALYIGPRIWLGVFLGAFAGNIWAYFSLDSLSSVLTAVGSASLNGVGDVLSSVLMAHLIIRFGNSARVLENYKSLFYFIVFGALIGPLLSAVFGVGGLVGFGHLSADRLIPVLQTWVLGDCIGVIILTPFVLSWLFPEDDFSPLTYQFIALFAFYALLVTGIAVKIIHFHPYIEYGFFLFLPALFYALIHLGQRLVFSVQVAVLMLAVISTVLGYGPFANTSQLVALTQLQVFSGIFSIVLFIIAILNLEKSQSKRWLEQRTHELEELYRRDALTKLWNRYRIKEVVELELSRFKRDARPFALLLLDIDDFKKINDRYGHLVGDQILTTLAQLINTHIRDIDFLGRWGGEEFVIIATNTQQDAAVALADKILALVNAFDFTLPTKVTLSIGMTLVQAGDSELTLFDRADSALYRAKDAGKNQAAFF